MQLVKRKDAESDALLLGYVSEAMRKCLAVITDNISDH